MTSAVGSMPCVDNTRRPSLPTLPRSLSRGAFRLNSLQQYLSVQRLELGLIDLPG